MSAQHVPTPNPSSEPHGAANDLFILQDDLPYSTRLRIIELERRHCEHALWQAQVALKPDSVHVTRGEALGWMYEDDHSQIQLRMECWDESGVKMIGRRVADRMAYYEKCVADERHRMARAVATAMSHDVGIFYMCGLMPDGHYRDRGFRFGLEPGQYLSAFVHG